MKKTNPTTCKVLVERVVTFRGMSCDYSCTGMNGWNECVSFKTAAGKNRVLRHTDNGYRRCKQCVLAADESVAKSRRKPAK